MNAQRFRLSGHLPALDGVRGLAILLVMIVHFFPSNYSDSTFLVIVGRFVDSGWIGVDLFFVLSGFLITGILLDSVDSPGYFRNFYARRTLRIFPLYYGVVFILLLLTPLLHFNWYGKAAYFLLYLQNFVIFDDGKAFNGQNILHIAPYIDVVHFWSLAIEEQFYLVWPALIALCRSPRSVVQLSVVTILLVLVARGGAIWEGMHPLRIYTLTFFRVDSLAFGALLAGLTRLVPYLKILRMAKIGVLCGSICIALMLVFLSGDWKMLPAFVFFGYTFLGLFFSCVIAVSLSESSFLNRLFHLGPLRFMGKYSYGLYVWHLLFFPYFAPYLRPFLNAALGSKILGGIVTGLSAAGLAFILAFLSFNLYEKHFLSLKRFFVSKSVNSEESSSSENVEIDSEKLGRQNSRA